MEVEKEIQLLKEEIKRLGTQKDGKYQVSYGTLFKDDKVANTCKPYIN